MEFSGLLGLLMLIVWIVMPFAVFGVKGRLDDLIEEARKSNELLRQLDRKLVKRD